MTPWVSGRLDGQHDLSRFDCGVTSLNQWLTGARERVTVIPAYLLARLALDVTLRVLSPSRTSNPCVTIRTASSSRSARVRKALGR